MRSGVPAKVRLTDLPWTHLVAISPVPEYVVKMDIFNSYQNLHIDSLASGVRIFAVGKARWMSLK